MTAESLLRAVAAALGDAGIPFMLTGSFASAYHRAGRATMDIGLVIDPLPAQPRRVRPRDGGEWDVRVGRSRREALADRSMFNIVDPESGWKVDLIVRKLRPFSEQEFARRQSVTSSAYDSTLRLWKT